MSDNEGQKKTAFNVGGVVVGALLASLSIFGIVQAQSSQEMPQQNSQVIKYDG